MHSITVRKVKFILMVLLSLLGFLLLMRLGFWQISRGHEKQRMIEAHQRMDAKKPLYWDADAKQLPQQYQKILLKGRWLPDLLFLDNQHYQHQLGYQVLSPLQLSKDKVVLVDRGWVKGSMNRQHLPKVNTPDAKTTVQGKVYFPSPSRWTLGPTIEQRADKIHIIEVINPKQLSQLLQKTVYPFIIRLDKNQANGFVREWSIVSMPPQRHYAYALQWFSMAVLLVIIFFALNFKKRS